MKNIPYHDSEAMSLELSGAWLSAVKRWQKVIILRPGNSDWIQSRIEYCIRRMVTAPKSISSESYSYDNYSYTG